MPWFPRVLIASASLTRRPFVGSSNPAARSLIPLSYNASFPSRKPKWPWYLRPPAPPSLPLFKSLRTRFFLVRCHPEPAEGPAFSSPLVIPNPLALFANGGEG